MRKSDILARTPISYAAVALLVALPALAGCGSSDNGVASKSAAEILAAARSAAGEASSVHVSGEYFQGKIGSSLDVQAAASKGARGKITLGKLTLEPVVIGSTVYLKGSPVVMRQFSRKTVPSGTWLKLTGPRTQLGQLVEQERLLKRLLSKPATLTKGQTTTVNGQKVVELKTAGAQVFKVKKLFTGSLYVATTGKPYPVAIVKSGLEHGTMNFSGWNAPVTLSAPTPAIDQ